MCVWWWFADLSAAKVESIGALQTGFEVLGGLFLLYFCAKIHGMTIERTASEIIIKIPAYVNVEGIQRLLDFLAYREATATSRATQQDVDKLVLSVKRGRWARNRQRYIP